MSRKEVLAPAVVVVVVVGGGGGCVCMCVCVCVGVCRTLKEYDSKGGSGSCCGGGGGGGVPPPTRTQNHSFRTSDSIFKLLLVFWPIKNSLKSNLPQNLSKPKKSEPCMRAQSSILMSFWNNLGIICSSIFVTAQNS